MIGLLLVWGALGVLGFRMGWTLHLRHGQATLLQKVRAAARAPGSCAPAPPATSVPAGQLTGVLDMPRLKVTAPVAQGTSDQVLDVAVGHAASTPMPGSPGTSVLLAHDVSYFANIDALQAGDLIRYTAGCTTTVFTVTGHKVVQAGAPVPEQPGRGLVLDTCWPTNALWYTPSRYLVEAVQRDSVTTAHARSTATTSWPTAYTTPAPPPLVAQGLDLTHNEQPMGTLALAGSPSSAWTQSPAPLAVEGAALEAYFGGLRSAAQHRADWWGVVAPGVTMPAPLSGAWVEAHDAPLDVRITARGSSPTAVELDTVVTLAGGPAPGRYRELVTEAVHGLDLVVTHWEVDHG